MDKDPVVSKESLASKEALLGLFHAARQKTFQATLDADFLRVCQKSNIGSEDYDSPAYWGLFARYVEVKQRVVNRDTASDHAQAELLSAYTPAAICHWNTLKANGVNKSEHVRFLSSYGQALRSFANSHRDASVNALGTSLLQMAHLTVAAESTSMQQFASQQIERELVGIQHEVGFARIIEAAGYPYTPATVDQDVAGKDYLIQADSHTVVGVDVKSSLTEVQTTHAASLLPYILRPNGDIVIYSCLEPPHFRGTFNISPEVAESRAPLLRDAVDHALLHRPTAYSTASVAR